LPQKKAELNLPYNRLELFSKSSILQGGGGKKKKEHPPVRCETGSLIQFRALGIGVGQRRKKGGKKRKKGRRGGERGKGGEWGPRASPSPSVHFLPLQTKSVIAKGGKGGGKRGIGRLGG